MGGALNYPYGASNVRFVPCEEHLAPVTVAGAEQKHAFMVMTDLIYVAVVAGFFVVGELYAHWCGKL